MSADGTFVDYYAVLGEAPNCNARSLEAAYHRLAKQYHPDHASHPDVQKFTEVIEAYRVLKEPEDRAAYDLVYARMTGFEFVAFVDDLAEEHRAYSDAEAHARILQALYKQRRENAHEPGIGRFHVQELIGCSDELFEFHIWYLKEKGLVVTTEQGTIAITIEGVDHVIATSRAAVKEKLFLEQSPSGSAIRPDE